MPNLYAHTYFASQVSREMGLSFGRYEPLYRLGSLGPDIFFYHRLILPLKNGQQLARRMHTQNVGAFIRAMLCETIARKPHNAADRAYLLGYLCHYCLDAQSHPYVFYMCGNGRVHTAFENYMDAQLMAHNGETLAHFVKACTFYISSADFKQAGAMFSQAVRAAYGMDIPADWMRQAAGGLRRALRALYDPTGRKRTRLRKLERHIKKPGLLSFAMLPGNVPEYMDTLNIKHAPWHPPFDAAETYRDSFLDLMQAARLRAFACVQAAEDAIKGDTDIGAAMRVIGDFSLHTGRSCREQYDFKVTGQFPFLDEIRL